MLLSDSISIHSTTRVETTIAVTLVTEPINFNPLHHEGGDLGGCVHWYIFFRFQSTPPRGWRRERTRADRSGSGYFNPLHHEGGDLNPAEAG